jgi:hypothetical protein
MKASASIEIRQPASFAFKFESEKLGWPEKVIAMNRPDKTNAIVQPSAFPFTKASLPLDETRPRLILWKCSLAPVEGFEVTVVDAKEPWNNVEKLGLSERSAVVILRANGEEFARLEGPAVTQDALKTLIELFHCEESIRTAAADWKTTKDSVRLIQLYAAQRRLSASLVAFQETSRRHEPSSELCKAGRQIAELALEMIRHEDAIPVLEYVREYETDEVARLEAWSRLIWCHLTLGNKDAARKLSEDPGLPSSRYGS